MTTTLEPCRAGFSSCDEIRADAVRRHPRTPSVRECRHLPIPPERPERLQGPEKGTLCEYQGRYQPERVVVRVVERSYVWAPGDPGYGGGSRRYDWKVVELPTGKQLCVDDSDLSPLGS